MHVFSFTRSIVGDFEKNINPDLHPHLKLLSDVYQQNGKISHPMINNAHWNEYYLPNDIMTPSKNLHGLIS